MCVPIYCFTSLHAQIRVYGQIHLSNELDSNKRQKKGTVAQSRGVGEGGGFKNP